ncbi:DNA-directed RNA polymerase II [Actinoplanes aureus]|uniref:DNA-directed RNA polymerase II n=1 Tax=Actinoplanes aureus TaxID=2792083 RepID=A0A931CCV0_9ACTN|nr:DNA-directed RNA polymerase II [Actinoplanes aureus]MBG0567744.1 DNA-directed RNA polymerase II [Actinoplanes aureus]
MPEQPQWSERTLDMPPQDPWAEPPTAVPTPPTPSAPSAPEQSPFTRGRARVTQRTQQFSHEHEPTGTGWPEEAGHAPHEPRSLSWHIRRLRRGSEWSNAALIFAFVCWGIWVLSSEGSFVTAGIVFFVTVCVAAGVFALSRLVGRLVLERQMGRVRHTARGSHMVAGLFLAGVGFAHLRQTEWVMDAFHWMVGLFS